VILFGTFSGTSVCARCGRIRTTMKFQVPLTDITYFRLDREHASRLSGVLDEGGVRRSHAHDWWFAVGGGNGVTCAIGLGRTLLAATGEPRVAAFVRNLVEHGSAAEAEQWLGALLALETSGSALQLLRDFPEAGFTHREEFESWRAEHRLTTFPLTEAR
jgi:hypothetical protein